VFDEEAVAVILSALGVEAGVASRRVSDENSNLTFSFHLHPLDSNTGAPHKFLQHLLWRTYFWIYLFEYCLVICFVLSSLMGSSDQEPLIQHFAQLQRYYASVESRIGYRAFLGGTRHFGLYRNEKSWPWPIGKALRAMEDHLFDSLGLSSGDLVLDAGCGYGFVAMHMAKRGLRVEAIDIVERHVARAKTNVLKRGLDEMIHIRTGDYHDLSCFEDCKFDGLYTMETLVHAIEPEKVLSEFFRVLKPGGSVAFYEYDHVKVDSLPQEEKKSMKAINDLSAMPANQQFTEGVFERMIENAGFENFVIRDISKRVQPMLWLFYIVAYLPYVVIKAFGLQSYFVNTMAAVETYQSGIKGTYRYVVVTARKPSSPPQEEGQATAGAERRRTAGA
jgi:sterol 24-C-methyltransferase